MASEAAHTPKIAHIANMRYPYADKWDKTRQRVEFELGNIHFSMANALRRIIMSHIPTIGFRSEPFKASQIAIIINDSPLHNQLLSHRIAMIPLHIRHPERFAVDDYTFIIDVSNDSTETIREITTADFRIKHIPSGKFMTDREVAAIFPTDPLTGDHIIITILKAKKRTGTGIGVIDSAASTSINKLHIEAKASIGIGYDNGHFSPVSVCAYINVINPEAAKAGEEAYIISHAKMSEINKTTPDTEEISKQKFATGDRARFYHKDARGDPNLFTFKIESTGIIPPLVLFDRGIELLKAKINMFISNMVNHKDDIITVIPSPQIGGGFNIIVLNEDDTLGNLIQTHLCRIYADYSIPAENRILDTIGYEKPHPLKYKIIFSIYSKAFKTIDEITNKIIKPGCGEITKMLDKIQTELHSTDAFITEMKSITAAI